MFMTLHDFMGMVANGCNFNSGEKMTLRAPFLDSSVNFGFFNPKYNFYFKIIVLIKLVTMFLL